MNEIKEIWKNAGNIFRWLVISGLSFALLVIVAVFVFSPKVSPDNSAQAQAPTVEDRVATLQGQLDVQTGRADSADAKLQEMDANLEALENTNKALKGEISKLMAEKEAAAVAEKPAEVAEQVSASEAVTLTQAMELAAEKSIQTMKAPPANRICGEPVIENYFDQEKNPVVRLDAGQGAVVSIANGTLKVNNGEVHEFEGGAAGHILSSMDGTSFEVETTWQGTSPHWDIMVCITEMSPEWTEDEAYRIWFTELKPALFAVSVDENGAEKFDLLQNQQAELITDFNLAAWDAHSLATAGLTKGERCDSLPYSSGYWGDGGVATLVVPAGDIAFVSGDDGSIRVVNTDETFSFDVGVAMWFDNVKGNEDLFVEITNGVQGTNPPHITLSGCVDPDQDAEYAEQRARGIFNDDYKGILLQIVQVGNDVTITEVEKR